VSSDFETAREPEDFDSERPDPEEPATWQHREQRSDVEVDDLDWADQHATVEDPLSEEEAPAE
jgi:hypothetical protein